MSNPWLSIPARDYDVHLSHPAVKQREFLDRVFEAALSQYEPRSIALLGCAAGGGLEFVDASTTERLVAVDLNPEFIELTRSRHTSGLPQLEVINADLETYEFESESFDLVHCALVLEYVDPDKVLKQIARCLSPLGKLVVVLQLPSPSVDAITETGCERLKLLAPLMRLHEPDDIRRRAMSVHLHETSSSIEELPGGKRFFIGHFCRKLP